MDKIISGWVRLYLVILLFTIPVKALSADLESRLYDLHQELQAVPLDDRLAFLENYCKKQMLDDNYREFLRFYEEEASRMNNKHHLANALSMLGQYYYPEHADSLFMTFNRLKPLVEEVKAHGQYIEIWALYNFSLAWEGRNEEMDQSVNALREYSQKVDYPKGQELADMNMAYFYYSNNMTDEAEKIYLDVLERKIRRNSPIIERITVFNQLFHYVSDKKKREAYLLKAEELIEEFKKQPNNSEEDKHLALIYEFSLHSTYVEMLMADKRYEEAFAQLKLLEKIPTSRSFEDERLTSVYHLYYTYYLEQQQYDQALDYLEKVETLIRKGNNLSSIVMILADRAHTYTLQKRYQEVTELQKEMMQLKDSINHSDFQEMIVDVRARYDMDRLELEKQQIEMDSQKTRTQMALLLGGCVLLLLALFGLILVMRSIQKSKQALREAKEKAENADRMKSAFLANMNHEIRTPLNAIVGFSQLIIEEVDPENKQEFAKIIENNNELLQRLIGDVLDISKIESNSMSLIYKEYELSQIMKELYNSMSLRVPDTIELILDPCETLTIETDRNRLVQVITNLMTNAIKHTSEGHIRFGFKRQDADRLYFYVEDTGEGIPPEQMEKIFDRFVQLENGTKGVGLGLAICKGLITQMGGRIGVSSVYGKGSTFHFTIPVRLSSLS